MYALGQVAKCVACLNLVCDRIMQLFCIGCLTRLKCTFLRRTRAPPPLMESIHTTRTNVDKCFAPPSAVYLALDVSPTCNTAPAFQCTVGSSLAAAVKQQRHCTGQVRARAQTRQSNHHKQQRRNSSTAEQLLETGLGQACRPIYCTGSVPSKHSSCVQQGGSSSQRGHTATLKTLQALKQDCLSISRHDSNGTNGVRQIEAGSTKQGGVVGYLQPPQLTRPTSAPARSESTIMGSSSCSGAMLTCGLNQYRSAFMRAWHSRVKNSVQSQQHYLAAVTAQLAGQHSVAASMSGVGIFGARHGPTSGSHADVSNSSGRNTGSGIDNVLLAGVTQQWLQQPPYGHQSSWSANAFDTRRSSDGSFAAEQQHSQRMFGRLQSVLARSTDGVWGEQPGASSSANLRQSEPPAAVPVASTALQAQGMGLSNSSPDARTLEGQLQLLASHAAGLLDRCTVGCIKKQLETCYICLEDIAVNELAPLLQCGHRMHKACLLRWVLAKLATEVHVVGCPVCKQASQDRQILLTELTTDSW